MPAIGKQKAKASILPDACVICDHEIRLGILADYPRPTSPEVTVHDVECGVCEGCGEKYFNAGQLRALERKTNEALREAKHYMTADEISQFLERLSQETGLSESRLAEALGVTRQELHRWKTSERIQSQTVEHLMRFASEESERFAAFINRRIKPPVTRGRPRKSTA